MAKVTDFFQEGGGLADVLPNFELRPSQVVLVDAIESAIVDHNHLVAEAGTGIGKTFSYLLPALLNDKQVLISTATKHLQEQIFFKDLPIVEKILGKIVSSCLLKGRSNYFCHHRYNAFLGSDFKLNKQQVKKTAKLCDWMVKTASGDLSEVAEFIEEDNAFKKKITSTRDNCLGSECEYFDSCFVQKIRKKAKKAKIVVINHSLLMADIVLKEAGFAEILPEIDVVIIDEAHHLPSIATEAFAEQVSSNQLIELVKDTMQIYHSDAGDVEGFTEIFERLINKVEAFGTSLSDKQIDGRVQLGRLKQFTQPYIEFKSLMQSFNVFLQAVKSLAERSNDLQRIYERSEQIKKIIKCIFSPQSLQDNNNEKNLPQSATILHWDKTYFRATRLPIYLDNHFQNIINSYADSWIFISSTLSLDRSFDFFIKSLGLPLSIPTLQVDSTFNYAKQSVIHVPSDLPEPNDSKFISALVTASLPILQKTKGRAFMLFTSYKNLHEAAGLMRDSCFNLFIQGEQPKSQLIDGFIKSDAAILMGTVSFWEGVDIAGEKLSCVIIDKIPFPSPTDPIIAEQSRYWQNSGHSAFDYCYIPKAATLLKQGSGRLIRSSRDTGVLIFGDSRILTKSYGQQLITSLPPAKWVNYEGLISFINNKLS